MNLLCASYIRQNNNNNNNNNKMYIYNYRRFEVEFQNFLGLPATTFGKDSRRAGSVLGLKSAEIAVDTKRSQ